MDLSYPKGKRLCSYTGWEAGATQIVLSEGWEPEPGGFVLSGGWEAVHPVPLTVFLS